MKRDRVERIARQTRFTFIAFLIVVVLITASALADRLFGLGWGYGRSDALWGLGIMLWGCLVYAMCRAIFKLVGRAGL